jgi:16S rRNA (cytidine1402-2'-O)-methyltransferase
MPLYSQPRPGTLFMIPTNLAEPIQPDAILPRHVIEITSRLDNFIVENARTARQFLKAVGIALPLKSLQMRELNEHTPAAELPGLLQPLLEGKDIGLLSEAGVPAVADPGANLVALAHTYAVPVVPLVGPSSILLALMASGLNGQVFAFHGYLPADRMGRLRALADLERESGRRRMTQIFIETPYRNGALLADILATCSIETKLCLALNLTAPDQFIATRCIGAWREEAPDLKRKPAVFLLLAEGAHSRRT